MTEDSVKSEDLRCGAVQQGETQSECVVASITDVSAQQSISLLRYTDPPSHHLIPPLRAIIYDRSWTSCADHLR